MVEDARGKKGGRGGGERQGALGWLSEQKRGKNGGIFLVEWREI